ncbi:MAG: PAS domain S-box protein [Actinomycetota bacterium]
MRKLTTINLMEDIAMKFYQRFLPYLVAIGSTAIALLLTLWLELLLLHTLGAFFYLAIVVTAWCGGWRSGFVAVVFSALAINYFFIPPRYQFTFEQPKDIFEFSIFLLVALTINLITSNWRESNLVAQENVALLRIAPSATQMGMWNWDIATGKIQWSTDREQLFGLNPGTFDGKYETFLSYIHPEDREAVNQAVQQAIQNNSLYQVEYRVVWSDGSIHWIESRGHAFYNQAGEPIQMTGTATAIDQRKQAQGLLQEKFEQQRPIVETTQRIRQSLNLKEIFQTTVKEIRQLLQTDRVIIFQFDPKWQATVVAESVGTNWTAILSTEIYDPCFGEQYVEPYKQGLVTVKSDIYKAGIDPCHLQLLANFQVRANLVVPIVKGGELWGLLIAHNCAAPRQWQSSEVDLMRQLANQLSIAIQQSELFEQVKAELRERQQAEAALREKEALMRLFIQYVPAGIAMFDREMRYLMASQRWVDEYNLDSIESLIGRSHYEIFPEIPQRWRQIHQRCLAGASEKGEEDLFIRASGKEQWVWWEVHPWYTAKDEIGGIVIFSVDLSGRKQAEMALKQLNSELEKRVLERTAELSQLNDRLQETLTSLQESEERHRLALDLTHIGFWDLHLPSKYLVWNDIHFTLLGLDPFSIQPTCELWYSCVHPDDLDWVEQKFSESIENHTDFAAEYRVIHPDGSVHWLMSRTKAVYDELGQPMRVLGVLLDISGRKRAEQEFQQTHAELLQHKAQLERVNQELQNAVKELQITEEELIRNNEELEAAVLKIEFQQQRYEDLFNFAPDGYLLTDSLGIIQEANQAASNLLSIPSSNLIGKPLSLYICNPKKRSFRTFITQMQQSSGRLISELTIVPRQGNSFPTEIAASPIRNWQGEIRGICWLIKDISDRKHAEQMLQLQAIITRNMAEGVCLIKADNAVIVYANPKFEQMFGYDSGELNGQHVSIVNYATEEVTAEDVNQAIRAVVFQSGEATYEVHNLKKDGTPFWCRATTSVFKHPDYGDVLVAVHQDITEAKHLEEVRKQTEEALAHSEAKFRYLSESSPIGIFMTDIHGQFIYTNPRYQVIFGCTFDRALGEGWVQFIHPEDRKEVTARWLKAVSQKQEFSGEIRCIHQDRTIRFCQVRSASILSVSNELIGYVGTVEDVTESRAIEKMKSEFISIVSHELRTPLASIRGSLGLLATGVLKNKPETAQEMLDIATHDTERLVRLVNDILDLERLESHKVNLNKQWCDAAALLQQSVETVQSLAVQSNIVLSVESSFIQVWADSDRILQTLVNLIGNAIKFSPPGTTVTLSVQDQAEQVLFQVKDQGRGIPADQLETIFGRFQQVDASDSRQKGGTGLGLAISKSIVQQHQGKIWVESVVGEGSNFYFTLPKPLD